MASDSAVWVVATGNAGKRVEFEQILASSGIEIRNLSGFGDVSFPEEGTDYRENAIEKARAAASQIGEIAVADDSGIEVAALDGRPGPLSARYGGEGLDDKGRVQKLLSELDALDAKDRSARFVCYAALSTPEGDTVVSYGECTGLICRHRQVKVASATTPCSSPMGTTCRWHRSTSRRRMRSLIVPGRCTTCLRDGPE
jgi:XTP/dITP diphosphohydrolase